MVYIRDRGGAQTPALLDSSLDPTLANFGARHHSITFMVDAPPAQASSSISNNVKSQTARGKQTTASARSKIITRPRTQMISVSPFSAQALTVIVSDCTANTAWAKDEPPSPTDNDHEPPSPGGSRGPTDARLSDVGSYNTPIGPSSEHRWFPFTRRRPMPGSEPFGAEQPLPPTVRLEKRPSILRSPSLRAGFVRSREEHSPARLGGRNQEQASPSTSPRPRDRSLRIVMPTTPAVPYTLSQCRTPGWDSPWAVKPLEPLSRRNIYETLQNGDTPDDQSPSGGGYDANDSWWPRTRKRARAYLLNNTYVPLVKHASVKWKLPCIPLTCSLAVSVHQYHVHRSGPRGGDSYTKGRKGNQFYRHSGQLTVRHVHFSKAELTVPQRNVVPWS